MNAKQRIAVEKRIARRVVNALIDAGYTVSVCDGEEYTVKRSRDIDAICDAMMTTDMDVLRCRPMNAPDQWSEIAFVYGNDGYDVISDYHMSLEPVLAPINALCDSGAV